LLVTDVIAIATSIRVLRGNTTLLAFGDQANTVLQISASVQSPVVYIPFVSAILK
jgi:hypothetical protein